MCAGTQTCVYLRDRAALARCDHVRVSNKTHSHLVTNRLRVCHPRTRSSLPCAHFAPCLVSVFPMCSSHFPFILLQPTELDQATALSGCVAPPCDIGGVPYPEVHYTFNQPVTPVEPHPLTLAAVQKAADALAQAQKAGDKEADNRKEIDKVRLGAEAHACAYEKETTCSLYMETGLTGHKIRWVWSDWILANSAPVASLSHDRLFVLE